MKLNYPELRGTEIIIICDEHLLPIKCIVIGAEYYKGITIVDSLHPETIRVCLIREASIKNKTLTKYRYIFHSLITVIRRGYVSKDTLCEIFNITYTPHVIPPSSCPFSK